MTAHFRGTAQERPSQLREHEVLPVSHLYGKDRELPSRKGWHKGCQTLCSLKADQNKRTPALQTAEDNMHVEILRC